jgi:hypothetical protein
LSFQISSKLLALGNCLCNVVCWIIAAVLKHLLIKATNRFKNGEIFYLGFL